MVATSGEFMLHSGWSPTQPTRSILSSKTRASSIYQFLHIVVNFYDETVHGNLPALSLKKIKDSLILTYSGIHPLCVC